VTLPHSIRVNSAIYSVACSRLQQKMADPGIATTAVPTTSTGGFVFVRVVLSVARFRQATPRKRAWITAAGNPGLAMPVASVELVG
jgi:hypothetical protein